MKRVTKEQLNALQAIAKNERNFLEVRKKCAEWVDDGTSFYTAEEMETAINARAAGYSPRDLGAMGKILEIEKFSRARLTAGKPILWGELHARKPSLDDLRVKANGRYYRIECKTGAGDFWKTACTDIASALDEVAKSPKYLLWETEEFTIFVSFSTWIEELEKYPLGAATFYKLNQKKHKLQTQEYKKSRKKIRFLQSIAERYPVPDEIAARIG